MTFDTLATLGLKIDGASTTAQLDAFTASAAKAGVAGATLEKSALGIKTGLADVAPVTIAGTRNMGAWAAIQAEGAARVGEHSLSLGRLERNLAGVIERSLGANATFGLLATSAAKFTLGTIETVGVLGVLAGAFAFYEKVTEDTRTATEEADKLVASLAKQNAMAAKGGEAMATELAVRTQLLAVEERIAFLRAVPVAAQVVAPAAPGGLQGLGQALAPMLAGQNLADVEQRFGILSGLYDKYIANRSAADAKLLGELSSARQKVEDEERRGALNSANIQASALSQLIASGNATAADRKNALALYNAYVADYAKVGSADLAMRANLLKLINDLASPEQKYLDSLKQEITTAEAKLDVDTASIPILLKLADIKGNDVLLTEHLNEAEKKRLDTLRLIQAIQNTTGSARAVLASGDAPGAFTIGTSDIPRPDTQRLSVLASTLAAGFQLEKQTEVKITAMTNEQIAARNAAELKAAQEFVAERERVEKEMWKEIQRTISNAFDDILTKGAQGFTALWETVKNGALKVFSDILASDVTKKLKDVFAQKGADGTPVASGSGSQSTSSLSSALPVIGVFVALLSGVQASFEGTARAVREANAAFVADTAAYTAAMQTFVHPLTGLQASLASDQDTGAAIIAKAKQALDDAKKAADSTFGPSWLSGTKADDQYAKALKNYADAVAQVSAAEAAHAAKLIADAQEIAKLDDEDLGVRAARAAGNGLGADALAHQIAEQRELDQALANGKSPEYIQHLKDVQKAEDAASQAAKQFAEKQAETNLDVRDLRAGGHGAAADALARTLAEQQEIAAAEAQFGTDSPYVKHLQQVQQDEDAAAAAAKKQADTAAAGDAQVRLLAAQGHTEEANAIRLQLQQQKEYQDDVAQGLSDATLAAVKLAQAAETAAQAAAAAAAAMDAALSHIEQQASVFGETPRQTLDEETGLYGFEGLTPDQVRARYTKFTPGEELTPTQIATNQAVTNWIHAWNAAQSSAANTSAGGGFSGNQLGAGPPLDGSTGAGSTPFSTSGTTASSTSFGTVVTSQVGDRMLDVLQASQALLRLIATAARETADNTRNLGPAMSAYLHGEASMSAAGNGNGVI